MIRDIYQTTSAEFTVKFAIINICFWGGTILVNLVLFRIGHIGHRAAGIEVGEDHRLVVAGEDVGRFGHEVHTAEHDHIGIGGGRPAREFERIADAQPLRLGEGLYAGRPQFDEFLVPHCQHHGAIGHG